MDGQKFLNFGNQRPNFQFRGVQQIQQLISGTVHIFMLVQVKDSILKYIPSHKVDFFGKNSLLFNSLPYYTLVFIIVVGIGLYELTKNPYLILFIIYGVIPLIDQIISLDNKNPTYEEAKSLANQLKFQIPIYLTILVDWIVFFYALNTYHSTELNVVSLVKLLGFVTVISNLNAAQFSISHQIMHKPGWRRVLGTFHMLKTLNMHFTYQHLYGHHRKVATQEDPASSRLNQNVYSFFIRSYFGAYKSVYFMQKENGKKFYNNLLILSVLSSIIFCSFILIKYDLKTFLFFMIQVLGAVFYLQVINFIEHYGLRRKRLENGEYQKVSMRHSWNAPHRLSNYLFFKLQRHSDHHENAMKPYQILLTLQQSPQLPHGYIVMTVMALFSPIYKRIMNPLVQNYQIVDQEKKKLVYQNAVQETRKFVVDLSIALGFLLMAYHFGFK